jgi:predicted O-methyltransferase YrrM
MSERTRYDNLFETAARLAKQQNILRYLEVGTYDGARACRLLKAWIERAPSAAATYHGFDLFEHLTPELSKAELSKSRLPPSQAEVLQRFRREVPDRVYLHLHQGNTRDTLPLAAKNLVAQDLIFLDGGHSLETIDSDWAALQPVISHQTTVLLDDYFENRDDVGCQRLVKRLQAEPKLWNVTLLDPLDRVEHTNLDIRMVRVQRRPME